MVFTNGLPMKSIQEGRGAWKLAFGTSRIKKSSRYVLDNYTIENFGFDDGNDFE